MVSMGLVTIIASHNCAFICTRYIFKATKTLLRRTYYLFNASSVQVGPIRRLCMIHRQVKTVPIIDWIREIGQEHRGRNVGC